MRTFEIVAVTTNPANPLATLSIPAINSDRAMDAAKAILAGRGTRLVRFVAVNPQ